MLPVVTSDASFAQGWHGNRGAAFSGGGFRGGGGPQFSGGFRGAAAVAALLASHDTAPPFLERDLAEELEPSSRQIGPYRVLEEIGSGASGIVYRAEQRQPRREVALKVLVGGVLQPEMRHRFRREAELAKNGFMPLVHRKNSDFAAFIGAQSLHKPAEYDDPDATANANLAAIDGRAEDIGDETTMPATHAVGAGCVPAPCVR